jgi:hypothetical protein
MLATPKYDVERSKWIIEVEVDGEVMPVGKTLNAELEIFEVCEYDSKEKAETWIKENSDKLELCKSNKMYFYYENNVGDVGTFEEDNIVKAIYTAWNIEANLYLYVNENWQIIFAPWESNEYNSELLESYGYKMIDADKYREIVETKTGKVIKYDWSEVKQLV